MFVFLSVSHLTVILSPAESSALKGSGPSVPIPPAALSCIAVRHGGVERLWSLVPVNDSWKYYGISLLDDKPNKYASGIFSVAGFKTIASHSLLKFYFQPSIIMLLTLIHLTLFVPCFSAHAESVFRIGIIVSSFVLPF